MHLLRELNKLPHGKQNKCSINVNYIKVAKYLTTLLDKIRFKHVFIMLMTWGDSMISFRKKKKIWLTASIQEFIKNMILQSCINTLVICKPKTEKITIVFRT